MRLLLVCLLAMSVAAQERPTFHCRRTSVDPREVKVACFASQTGGNVPTWRLYGDSEDALMDFNEGFEFSFLAPDQWRLLEMRVTTENQRIAVRAWVQQKGGKLQWKQYGQEGASE